MLENLNLLERQTQDDVIRLLQEELGYRFLGNLDIETQQFDAAGRPVMDTSKLARAKVGKQQKIRNTNLRITDFINFQQKQGWTYTQAEQAYNALRQLTSACHRFNDIYSANEAVYNMLTSFTTVTPTKEAPHRKTLDLILWDKPELNDFAFAEEVSVLRDGATNETRRPDIVVYINGIAVAVLELKRAAVSVAEGIRQSYRNQQDGEIPSFFSTIQLVLAGNRSEGLYYGTIKTPEKHFAKWKEPCGNAENEASYRSDFTEQRIPDLFYRSLLQMLDKRRLLEIIRDGIIFDGGIKKVARPNQYFALKAAQPRIRTKDSGIIWHSQGSGKSLTMVWLAKWIHREVDDARIIVITDRDELDKQITERFQLTGENEVQQASSGKQLLGMLNRSSEPWLITTLVHKFGSSVRGGKDAKEGEVTIDVFLAELRASLPKGFKAKGNIFVFVDECHRTQGGKLNRAMKEILGQDVMFIGFTGTPLLKKDKNTLTSKDNFGRYIHTYKFNEAVDDGVILDLRYEARAIDQQLSDADALNQIFEHQTRALTPKARMTLQDRWAHLQKVYSSHERMMRIVGDILKDMMLQPALSEGYGNAMLVTDSIYSALKYWHLFAEQDFGDHCAVVCSYDDETGLDEGYTGEKKTEEELKSLYFHQMIGDKPYEQFEEEVKQRFIKQPADMKLLIVVNKLLTGFDAPSATYLYLDKSLQDHDLFQAICRVNRVNGAQKEFGYIIDYMQLFPKIEDAIQDYTNGAFQEYEKKDVEGLLKDRLVEAREELDAALIAVHKLCEHVEQPRELNDFFDYFCVHHTTPADEHEAECIRNAPRREAFYQAVMRLSRRYTMIAMQMDEAGYSETEIRAIATEVHKFDELRHAILKCSGDYVDLKMYDAQMRALLDRYIIAPRCEKLEALDDFSFLDIINIDPATNDVLGVDPDAEEELGGERGVSEIMTSNVRRVINRKRDANPAEYKYFSERLNRLLEDLRQKKIEYRDFLRGIRDLANEMRTTDKDPWNGKCPQKKAFYDNFGHDEQFANYLFDAVRNYAKMDYKSNPIKKRQIERVVGQALIGTPYTIDEVMRIIVAYDW